MSYLRNLFAALLGRKRVRSASAFPGASISRLTADWTVDPGSINRWLRFELRTIRARSRQLARAEGYASKFVRSCVQNVAGPAPFQMIAKLKQGRRSPGSEVLELDRDKNRALESAWYEWCRQCEVTGKMSLGEVHRLNIRNLARDGEILVRVLKGREYGPWGMQLQVLDIDRLDDEVNSEVRGVGVIKMGVQMDTYGKPTAYHLLKRNPGEFGMWAGRVGPKEHEVIGADQVFHLFIPDWPEQARGLPWMHAAMTRMYHLGGFEEATIIAARTGAMNIAFLKRDSSSGSPADIATMADVIVDSKPTVNMEAGTAQALPAGWDIADWNPKYPDAVVEPFMRSCLRGIAASVGVAYHSFANDPSNVNYSTARVALLEERDMWQIVQRWYIEHFCEPLFREWLTMAVTMGKFGTEYLQQPKLEEVRWQPKRWQWVDPKNETDANVNALENRLTSRSRIVAEQGEDWEDIAQEIAEEQGLAEKLGIELEPEKEPAAAAPAPKEEPETDKAIERMHADVQRLLGSNVVQLPTRMELTFNQAPVNLTMPPAGVTVHPAVVKNTFDLPEREVHIHAGDTHVAPADVRVETPITVQPAEIKNELVIQPPAVSVPVTVEGTTLKVEAPRVEVPITVQPAEVQVPVTVEGARVEVGETIVNLPPPDDAERVTEVELDASGNLKRTVTKRIRKKAGK